MKKLSSFLDKFKNITPSNKVVEDTVIDVVEEVLDMELEEGQVKLDRNVIYINTSPIRKNRIHIYKHEIIDLLNNRLNKKTVKDIR